MVLSNFVQSYQISFDSSTNYLTLWACPVCFVDIVFCCAATLFTEVDTFSHFAFHSTSALAASALGLEKSCR